METVEQFIVRATTTELTFDPILLMLSQDSMIFKKSQIRLHKMLDMDLAGKSKLATTLGNTKFEKIQGTEDARSIDAVIAGQRMYIDSLIDFGRQPRIVQKLISYQEEKGKILQDRGDYNRIPEGYMPASDAIDSFSVIMDLLEDWYSIAGEDDNSKF